MRLWTAAVVLAGPVSYVTPAVTSAPVSSLKETSTSLRKRLGVSDSMLTLSFKECSAQIELIAADSRHSLREALSAVVSLVVTLIFHL